MPISAICSIASYRGRLAIGYDNDLLVNCPADMTFFMKITKGSLAVGCGTTNYIVMGRKTWESIGSEPLKGRINIVLSTNAHTYKDKDTLFMTFDQFKAFYNEKEHNVFVIGGGKVFDLFLNDPWVKPEKLYITEIKGLSFKDKQDPSKFSFISTISPEYKLIGWSPKYDYISESQNINIRFLHYRLQEIKNGADFNSVDLSYKELVYDVLKDGQHTIDRTKTGTVSVFGKSISIDISSSFPLLTVKSVPFKSVLEELLFFLKGQTNSKILTDKGVPIWKGNSTREFLDSRNLNYPEHELGPVYGYQWRRWGAKYPTDPSVPTEPSGTFDQIQQIIDTLKTDPTSRRMVLSAWNVSDLDKMVLPPCHLLAIFKTTKVKGSNVLQLNCHLVCRSTDIGLGLPFNLASYALLTMIIAKVVGMTPGRLFYTGTDVHIYLDHTAAMESVLGRTPRVHPRVSLKTFPSVLESLTAEYFELIGYFPNSPIKMNMSA